MRDQKTSELAHGADAHSLQRMVRAQFPRRKTILKKDVDNQGGVADTPTMTTKYWSASEVLNGIKERPAKMRRILGGKLRARFVVICDGGRTECDTMPALDKLMSCTYAEAPKVFHNWDNGITINFDEKA